MTRTGALLIAILAAGCAPLPQRTDLPVEQRPSPNYNERRPNYVILHHSTNDTAARALATLTSASREVSAHYLIGRDGTIYYLVDELNRAWHAGRSYWGGNTDMNSVAPFRAIARSCRNMLCWSISRKNTSRRYGARSRSTACSAWSTAAARSSATCSRGCVEVATHRGSMAMCLPCLSLRHPLPLSA